jgi:BRCT domain type II-containing protein
MSHNLLVHHDSFGPREMGIAKDLKIQLANEYPLHER